MSSSARVYAGRRRAGRGEGGWGRWWSQVLWAAGSVRARRGRHKAARRRLPCLPPLAAQTTVKSRPHWRMLALHLWANKRTERVSAARTRGRHRAMAPPCRLPCPPWRPRTHCRISVRLGLLPSSSLLRRHQSLKGACVRGSMGPARDRRQCGGGGVRQARPQASRGGVTRGEGRRVGTSQPAAGEGLLLARGPRGAVGAAGRGVGMDHTLSEGAPAQAIALSHSLRALSTHPEERGPPWCRRRCGLLALAHLGAGARAPKQHTLFGPCVSELGRPGEDDWAVMGPVETACGACCVLARGRGRGLMR